MADTLEKIAEGMAEIRELMQAPAPPPPPGNSSTSGVHFHGSAGLSIIGVVAICAAIAVLSAVSAFYWASMQELKALRVQVGELKDTIDITEAKRGVLEKDLANLKIEVSQK